MSYDYDLNDQVTLYVITLLHQPSNSRILRAYTDDKVMADFYMQFHQCPSLRLEKITDEWRILLRYINSNPINVITIVNINTRDPNKRNKCKVISVPMTALEEDNLKDFCAHIGGGYINFTSVHDVEPQLKNKYREALSTLGLQDVVKLVIYNQNSKFTQNLECDHLRIIFRLFPAEFN